MKFLLLKSRLFFLALVLLFLGSSAPILAIQNSGMMRVSPLKAGRSKWVLANNNPVNFIDPEGLQEEPATNFWQHRMQNRAPEAADPATVRDGAETVVIFGLEVVVSGGSGKAIRMISKWNKARKAVKFAGFTKSQLLRSSGATGKGGQLTKIGHALQKHGGRKGSSFKCPSGNESVVNDAAETWLTKLLGNSPKTTRATTGLYGKVIEIRDPVTNKGARFNDAGDFIGLLEP